MSHSTQPGSWDVNRSGFGRDSDVLRESAHRALLRAHLAEGNLAEARRAYRACEEIFERELGVIPSPATTALLGTGSPPVAAPNSVAAAAFSGQHGDCKVKAPGGVRSQAAVVRGRLVGGLLHGTLRQQTALEGERCGALLGVPAGTVEVHRRAGADLLNQQEIGVVEGGPVAITQVP
ncbi:bacterial transcriptional activator domain-containing protein [Streptomyces sp. NPDC002523]